MRTRTASQTVALLVLILSTIISNAAYAQSGKLDILKTLNFQKGTIILGDNLATVSLTDRFRFIDSRDTQTFLTKIWGNAPGTGAESLGMILPVDVSPLSTDGWGVIVTYVPTGYISDDDATKIDYGQLLREMQEATREQNKEYSAKGYPTHELIGWARQPYYDNKTKKLYWAKRLRFEDARVDTLNFDIRILGRRGVLSLNVIDDIDGLQKIDREIPNLLNMVSFKSGNLYSEFNPSIDQAAAYGLAGLIAGGVLTKAGFFKGLLVLLLASKKLLGVAILGGLATLWVGLKALFHRKSQV